MAKNLLGIKDLKREDVEWIVEKAIRYKHSEEDFGNTLKGKTVIMLFFESSTRTRTSFEMAAKKMQAEVVNIDYEKSSLKKGETDYDTITNLATMHPDAFVIRHSEAGYPSFLSRFTDIPIINAGDGTGEHPSQALLDAVTMHETKKRLEGLNICIIGDIINSRVAKSHMEMARLFGWNLSVYGPPTMLPFESIPEHVRIEKNLKSALQGKDFIILLRIQLERKSGNNLPSLGEYSRFFGISHRKAEEFIGKETFIMHPGPVNRGVELSSDVMDTHPRILIHRQVENGIYTRMAIYSYCLTD